MAPAPTVASAMRCVVITGMGCVSPLRLSADDTCRAFGRHRRGLMLGEGAGLSADAADIVMPDAGGAARAMRAALAGGGLGPQDVGCINAHGTGTAANDATETRAIRAVFGARADALAVSSTKSMHGHALGAGGALELVATIGALREGLVPPTINDLEPDPACDLNVVPNVAQERPLAAALSNSFAFGGLNAVLALRRWG